MKIISKFEEVRLAFGLSNSEFACRCDFDACRFTLVSPKLLEAYETFRQMVNKPLTITSGYRCQAHHFHNVYKDDIEAVTASRHLTGEGIDISIKNLLTTYHFYTIIELAKNAGFTYVKHYENEQFIHCDVR